MELDEPLVLPPVLWTKTSAGEHQHERIALLQLRERAVLAAVVRKLVVGKDCAGDDVGPHRRAPSMWSAASLAASSGVLPALARDDVGGVPPRPVVLRSGRFVLAMALLCLSQKLGQSRDVQVAESSSGKTRLDLLEQPAVAVRIAERGERAIAGVVGCGPADSTARAVALELSSRRPGVEHLADLGTAGDELVACSLDVGDDQVEALGRARRGRRDVRAELDRAPRAGRRELDDPEAVIESEIGVQPPPQAPVEALGAIDVGHRNDDDLELQIDRRSSRRIWWRVHCSSVWCSLRPPSFGW